MKGIVRIGGALAIGIVIISGAFYVKNTQGTEANGRIVVAQAPERTYIETTDSNKDGVKDWEENLRGKVFETIATPPTTISTPTDEAYEPPTTFTGKFSEAFFKDYLQGKIDGVDFNDPSGLVGNAVTAIEQNTASKKHSRLELTIVPSTPDAIHAYGNRVSEIMKTHSIENENEALILKRALDTNEPKVLEALAPIYSVYANTITDTLRMEVPSDFVEVHINLLNAYESIKTDIGAMQTAFTDPLYTLARVKNYEDDAKNLFTAFETIAKKLNSTGTSYTNDETGSFFYLFDS